MSYEAHIETEDENFASELMALEIPGVEITSRLCAAAGPADVFWFTVGYAAKKSIDLFALWMEQKIMIKGSPHNTRLNGLSRLDKAGEITDAIMGTDGIKSDIDNLHG